jgi:hypothetical protein
MGMSAWDQFQNGSHYEILDSVILRSGLPNDFIVSFLKSDLKEKLDRFLKDEKLIQLVDPRFPLDISGPRTKDLLIQLRKEVYPELPSLSI